MTTTQLFSASEWRSEPDQMMSDSTRRLLAWLRRLHESDGDDVEDVAARIGLGLRELTDAHTVVVFARDVPGDALRLLAISQQEDAPPLDEGFEEEATQAAKGKFDSTALGTARFPAAPLWASLPFDAFWMANAPAHLQVFIGEACDWLDGLSLNEAPNTTLTTTTLAPDDSDEASLLPALALPLRSHSTVGHGEIIGLALLWIFTDDGLLSSNLQPLVAAAGTHAADAMSAALRMERLGHSYRQLAELIAKISDARQPQRAGHAQAVGYYAGLIAQELGLSMTERERIEFAGLLHDAGKAGVPDAILHKQDTLTPEELDMVRGSIVSGAEWLSEVEGLQEVALMVRHQNERWDGGGLPDGLTGEAIPLGARILAVSLRFAAMTQPRADRGPRPVVGGALDFVAAESGTALDPQVVRAFLTALGRSL